MMGTDFKNIIAMKKNKLFIISLLNLFFWLPSCSTDEGVDFVPSRPSTGTVHDIKVSVDRQTVEKLGGESIVQSMLYSNFSILSNEFNLTGEFNETHFFMNDFSVFDGTSRDELSQSSEDFKFIINESIGTDDIQDGYYEDERVIHLSSNTVSLDRLFSQEGTDYFTYAMGLALGAFDLSGGDVELTNNPFTPLGHQGQSSYMNSKNITDSWDDLSVRLINAVDGFSAYVPSQVDLSITNSSGSAAGINVTVFPIRWNSGVVSTIPSFEGTTDSNGRIVLDSPYQVANDVSGSGEDYYANLLIRLNVESSEKYFYVPIENAVLSALETGNTTYELTEDFDVVSFVDIRVTRFSFENSADLGENSANIAVSQNVTHSTDSRVGNGAIEFSGSNHLILDQSTEINAGSDYSVAYWFKTSSFSPGQNALWTMSQYSGNTSDDPWVPGGLTFRFFGNTQVNYDVGWEGGPATDFNVADNQWHHLVTTIQYDENAPDRANINMYIDGVLVMSGNNSIKQPFWGEFWPDWSGTAPIENFVVKIGYSSTAGDAAVPFVGLVDDLQVFNAALDESLVFQLFSENQ